MKKILIIFMLLLAPAPLLAKTATQAVEAGCEFDQNLCEEKSVFAPDGIVHKATNTLIFLIGALAAIYIILAGFKYVLSAGDPKSIAAAKDTLTYAVIGVIVALIAASLVNFVIFKVSGGQ